MRIVLKDRKNVVLRVVICMRSEVFLHVGFASRRVFEDGLSGS